MLFQFKLYKQVAILTISVCAVLPAFAADAVTDAMQAAYGPYRVALLKPTATHKQKRSWR
jgi:hypothetical protein